MSKEKNRFTINPFEIYKKIRKQRSKGTRIEKDKRGKSRQQQKIDLKKEY